MMKVAILLALAFLCVASAQFLRLRPPGVPNHWRLIETGPNERKWMSPETIHEKVEECGKAKGNDQHHGGFFDVTDFPDAVPAIPEAEPLPTNCRYDAAVVNPFINGIKMQNWVADVTNLSSLPTRYYTNPSGVKGAEYIYEEMKKICGSKCSVNFFNHTWPQPSVIARVQGKTNDVIIVGAHLDSTASPSTANAPGADDDASGCGTVLEVARVLVNGNFSNTKTIEFQFYAAEELGLLGSQAIATDYANKGVDVYAMIQFDMTGYTTGGRPPVFVTDNVDTALTECLRTIGSQLGHNWASSRCGYACSDHASWTRQRYRSAFPFEIDFSLSNRAIHTVNDKINLLSVDHAKQFVELGVAGVIRLDKP